jgi:hypothetical protein
MSEFDAAGFLEQRGVVVIPPELLDRATPEEREAYLQYLVEEVKKADDWEAWVRTFFPKVASMPFSDGHKEFFSWVWELEKGTRPKPWISIWPRGHGKSTCAEIAVAAVAARDKRKYAIYVAETQEQADDHVANIAALLQSPIVEIGYPTLGQPKVNKEGHSRGWRRDRLVTSTGFVIDALGLDSAARGVKFEENRPDFALFDDIDGELDTEERTLKKIKVITHKLLPAGSQDCAILMVQNLVHQNSIFARLCSTGKDDEPPPADFLRDRIVSGPIPAIWDLEVEDTENNFVITGGVASWPEGFPLDACQALINDIGLSAFMAECQHKTEPPEGEIFSHLKYVHRSWDDVDPDTFKRVVVFVDPAVSSSDTSDSMGIQCDALGKDNCFYRLFSWEQRATPYSAMRKAIEVALQYRAELVGVEVNQGKDTWRVVYDQAMTDLRREYEEEGKDFFRKMPRYKDVVATKDLGSKVTRAERMLVDYERGRFFHMVGTHQTLEAALKRFPKVKPFDLVDASYWSWNELAGPLHRRKARMKGAARRAMSQAVGIANAPTTMR